MSVADSLLQITYVAALHRQKHREFQRLSPNARLAWMKLVFALRETLVRQGLWS
jgi:hypothetical protein